MILRSKHLPTLLIEGKVPEDARDAVNERGELDLPRLVDECVERLDPHPGLRDRVREAALEASKRIGFPMGESAEFDLHPWLAPGVFWDGLKDLYEGGLEGETGRDAEVLFISVHHHKRGVSDYVYRTLERFEPEAVCLETSPAGLETALHYTLSPLPHAGIEVLVRVPVKMLLGVYRDLYGALVYCLRSGAVPVPVDVPASLRAERWRRNPTSLEDPSVHHFEREVDRTMGPTGELFFLEYERVEPELRHLGERVRANVPLLASEEFVRFHLSYREEYMLSRIAQLAREFDRLAVVVGAVHTSEMERRWNEGSFRYREPKPEGYKAAEWTLSPEYKRHKLVVEGESR
ncbi:hypothetical protein [Methanopyrus sp.]